MVAYLGPLKLPGPADPTTPPASPLHLLTLWLNNQKEDENSFGYPASARQLKINRPVSILEPTLFFGAAGKYIIFYSIHFRKGSGKGIFSFICYQFFNFLSDM
jgi:hypothetical protein